jgi:hypothetical protein
MTNAVTVWQEPVGNLVPKAANTAPDIVVVAQSLSTRDQRQIVTAFSSESYEMMAGFVLNKALSQLKRQLSTLGMEFVGEMLGRPDLDEDSIPTVSISDYEAITLARELGIINSTDSKRLTQHLELLAHFDSLHPNDAEFEEMTQEEALSFLRTCVNSVLGKGDNFAPIEFVQFRTSLEARTFKKGDAEIAALEAAPYFFKRTTLSILISNVKTKSGAQFEHSLGNTLVIVPVLWPHLRDNERWSVGQAYAEVVNAGNNPAVLALKKALTAINGFDYVPETLRSQTFSAAASNVISVHTGMNNFYNEPSAVSSLAKLGSSIPWPAFPICMSAIVAVYLGNGYGRSWAAQPDVKQLLLRLSNNQWEYYLNECLPRDELVLQKIAWWKSPRDYWKELVQEFALGEKKSKRKNVQELLDATTAKIDSKITSSAERLIAEKGK